MAIDYVRVRDRETGAHVSISRARYERQKDLWQELKQPATDAGGTPLPVKHRTSVSTEAEKKASRTAASDNKEK